MNTIERYNKAIYYLEGLSNLPMKGDYIVKRQHLGVYLKRMKHFLNLIGNPQKNFKYIHIAGTAGKGTVTNMTHEILCAAGKNVGSFTSPFVTTSIEKIKVKDAYISPNELADTVEYLKPFIDEEYIEGPYGRPSYFEIFLAIALVYFERQKCEWVVLEVGLGGRYDATNIIEKPVITAITNIDYDHTEILGKTLREIGHDKAGIIKRGSIFYTTEQRSSLIKMFKEICDKQKIDMIQMPKQSDYEEYNKALATVIAKTVGVSQHAINEGIQKAHLPCRFEIVSRSPLVVLDGAHNRAKVRSTIGNLKKLTYKNLYLIIGIADNKDSTSILEQIIPLAHRVYVTRFQIKDRKCAHPKRLATASKKYLNKDSSIEIFLDPEQALRKALKNAQKDDLVVAAGSFFLAGELRKKWFPEEMILKTRKSS